MKLPATVSRDHMLTVVRYFISGGALFMVDLAVFLTLRLLLEVPSPLAQFCSRTTGATLGFALHKLFTFRNRDRDRTAIVMQGTGYAANTIFTILFSPAVVVFFEYLLPGRLVLVKLLTEAVMICETYLALRFIFKSRGMNSPNRELHG